MVTFSALNDVLFNLGIALRDAGRHAAALAAFHDALTPYEPLPGEGSNVPYQEELKGGKIHTWIGLVHLENGRWDEALQATRRAEEIAEKFLRLPSVNQYDSREYLFALACAAALHGAII